MYYESCQWFIHRADEVRFLEYPILHAGIGKGMKYDLANGSFRYNLYDYIRAA